MFFGRVETLSCSSCIRARTHALLLTQAFLARECLCAAFALLFGLEGTCARSAVGVDNSKIRAYVQKRKRKNDICTYLLDVEGEGKGEGMYPRIGASYSRPSTACSRFHNRFVSFLRLSPPLLQPPPPTPPCCSFVGCGLVFSTVQSFVLCIWLACRLPSLSLKPLFD